jgi:hypothetical protein
MASPSAALDAHGSETVTDFDSGLNRLPLLAPAPSETCGVTGDSNTFNRLSLLK